MQNTQDLMKWEKCQSTNGEYREPLFVRAYELTKHLKGPVLEFGVYNGDSAMILAGLFKGDKIYGFDSWEGLPEDDFPDGYHDFHKGKFKTQKPNLSYYGVELVDGLFKDTLPTFVKEHPEPAKFINIDCDLYSSTKDVFDHVIVQSGTCIYFDEYRWIKGWEKREYAAFMEFIERTGYDYEYILKTDRGINVLVQLQ